MPTAADKDTLVRISGNVARQLDRLVELLSERAEGVVTKKSIVERAIINRLAQVERETKKSKKGSHLHGRHS